MRERQQGERTKDIFSLANGSPTAVGKKIGWRRIPAFAPIVARAARLIYTTPEFDDLAAEVGLGNHANGITASAQRAQLRAELDGLIAHVYGLTEEEFTHILSTFPLVDDSVKGAALAEYRRVE